MFQSVYRIMERSQGNYLIGRTSFHAKRKRVKIILKLVVSFLHYSKETHV